MSQNLPTSVIRAIKILQKTHYILNFIVSFPVNDMVQTPRHAPWLNQIETWFSILARKLIQRGNLISKADLRAKIDAFIDFFNKTMAKPFKWTYAEKPLTI